MDVKIDTTTAKAIFQAAATCTGWQRGNLGLVTHVQHEGYRYRVIIPSHGYDHPLVITDCRSGWGGVEWVSASAAVGTFHDRIKAQAEKVVADEQRRQQRRAR